MTRVPWRYYLSGNCGFAFYRIKGRVPKSWACCLRGIGKAAA